MAKRNCNKLKERERTGCCSRSSKKHLVSPMCPRTLDGFDITLLVMTIGPKGVHRSALLWALPISGASHLNSGGRVMTIRRLIGSLFQFGLARSPFSPKIASQHATSAGWSKVEASIKGFRVLSERGFDGAGTRPVAAVFGNGSVCTEGGISQCCINSFKMPKSKPLRRGILRNKAPLRSQFR
jgi:hypothetical protein